MTLTYGHTDGPRDTMLIRRQDAGPGLRARLVLPRADVALPASTDVAEPLAVDPGGS
jgi:hypothetical protein